MYNPFPLTASDLCRIFSKISIDTKTECWIWLAAKNRGYGAFRLRRKTFKIHRLLYEVFKGPLPKYDGHIVLDHVVCDNPNCCNPDHVILTRQCYNVLRGNSISAKHLKQTHCPKGHEYSTKLESWGKVKPHRRCIVCRKANKLRRYHERKNK